MERLAPLLILLVTANVALSTDTCGLSKEHYELFTKIHRNMNLTLDCDAVQNAFWGTYLMLVEQKPDHVNTDYWCKYTATSWEYVADPTWVEDTLLGQINFDKVAQTALLHPQTKYGCAARRVRRNSGIRWWQDYALLCIYEKKAPQALCNIEWSY
ncbi:hypothetical protein Q1695_003594 [Nippostrongylus brasiliensis]|nr:hypothetical protein Q1695_003594 [Nippostrongylus brasiliensis]